MTTITDRLMTSDTTPHTARRIAIRPGNREYWRVSWLPDRACTRNQAITAMTIAELVAEGLDRTRRQHIVCFASELDLDGPYAAQLAAGPPHVLDRRFHTMSLDCWCRPITALDGHRSDGGVEPEFAATDGDPVTPDGFLLEELA